MNKKTCVALVPKKHPRSKLRKKLPEVPLTGKVICSAAATLALFASPAMAANVTWDSDATYSTGVTDGSGTWDSTTENWYTSSADAAWVAGDTAVFGNGGTAGTVTVSGSQSVYGITFNSGVTGTYTLTGGTIGLTNGAITVNADATINSALVGTVTLSKNGNSTLTLGGTNSLSSINVNNAGSLVISGNTTLTGNCDLKGTGGLLVTGTLTGSKLEIANGSGVSTGVTVSSGLVNFTTSIRVNCYNSSAGYLAITGGTVNTPSLLLNDTNSTSGSGTATLTMTGGVLNVNSFSLARTAYYSVDLSSGTIGALSSALSSSLNMTLHNGSTSGTDASGNITFRTSGTNGTAQNITLSGVLSGTGGLNVTGGGTLTLSGSSIDYTGITTIQSGTLAINTNGLDITFASAIDSSSTGGFTKLGDGNLTLTGGLNTSGQFTLSSGTVILDGNTSTSGQVWVQSNTTVGLNLTNGATLNAAGLMVSYNTGSNILTIGGDGTGTVDFGSSDVSIMRWGGNTSALNITGGTVNAAGTLQIMRGGGLGVLNVSGGLFNYTGTNWLQESNSTGTVSGTGAVYLSGSGALTFTNTDYILGNWNQGTGILGVSGGTLDLTSHYLNIVASSGTSGALSTGTVSVSGGTVSTTGIYMLGKSGQTYAQAYLTITGGVVNIGSGGISNTGDAASTGNSYAINLSSGTIGARDAGWSSSLDMTLNNGSTNGTDASGNITFRTSGTDGNGYDITLSGALSGTGGLNVVDPSNLGEFILSGTSNTYTGATKIYGGGYLLVGANNAISTASALILGGTDNSVGTVDLGGYSQTVASLDSQGTGANTMTNTGGGTSTLTVANGGTYAGVIADGDSSSLMALSVTGGNLILNGANTYSGVTTVTGGTLTVNGSLAAASAVSVTGAMLSGSGTIGGTVSGNSAAIDGNGLNMGVTTLNGTSTLSGYNIASSLTVASGTTALTGTTQVTSGLSVSAGATFNNNGVVNGDTVVSGLLKGSGTFNGALSLSGTLAPGNSPGVTTINGDLTMDSTAVLAMEVTGASAGITYDQIQVSGSVALAGTLDLSTLSGLSLGDTITLIDNTSSNSTSGYFAEIITSGSIYYITGSSSTYTVVVGGTEYLLNYAYAADGDNIYNDVALSVVPEPRTWVMMLGGLGLLMVGRGLRRWKVEI